jgi:hypothetical protein
MPDQIITTVTVLASTYDLTLLATLKEELNVSSSTDDKYMGRVITETSRFAMQSCNRVFAVETLTDVIELDESRLDGWDVQQGSIVQLSRWPVTAIQSLVERDFAGNDLALVQDTDFTLDPLRGQVIRLYPPTGLPNWWWGRRLTVAYTAGYAAVPPDLEGAVLRLCVARVKARGRDPLLRSFDDPRVGIQTWWVGSPGTSGSLPEEIAGVLNNYRVPVAG